MNKIINNKGFTLVELIIALGVFSSGIMAAFTLALAGLNTSIENFDRINAANLAREGIELVRNERDSNWLKIDNNVDIDGGSDGIQYYDWDQNINNGYYSIDKNGIYDQNESGLLSCDPNGLDCIENCPLCELKYDSSLHLYLHSGDTSTNIFRAIEIFDICLDDNWDEKIPDDHIFDSCSSLAGDYKTIGLEVTSRVFWEKAGKKHYTDVKEKLYNWKRW